MKRSEEKCQRSLLNELAGVPTLLLLLSRVSAQCNSERELQDRVAKVLTEAGIKHHREFMLPGVGRLDFYVYELGIAIETKTKDGRAKVLRQIKAYADEADVRGVIVMSRQPLAIPATLSGKPIYNAEIWKNFA
jgi:hypothetical protein